MAIILFTCAIGCGGGAPGGGSGSGGSGANLGACADGVCGADESCSSCPEDCGSCTGTSSSSSSSTSSSSSSSGAGSSSTSSSSSSGKGSSSGSGTSSSSSSSTGSSSSSSGTTVWCGDGACNGTENQSNCCKDCGCPGQLVCNGNTCEAPCATEAFDLYNEWPNEPFYSVGCGYTLTEFSGLLVCNSSSCVWAPSGGYDIATLSWGTTETLTYQCCLYDGVACNDYTHNGTCTINGQQVACNCSAPASITLTANACQTVSTTLCTP